MALPHIIENLLTLRRSSGGFIVHQGSSQTVIPLVPPHTEFVLEVFPFESDYFDIIYKSFIDPSVLPGVYYAWGAYYGSRINAGTLNSGATNNILDSFVFISQAEPGMLLIRNNTALNQYYAGGVDYLAIASAFDYDLVLDALKGMGASETNHLLSLLAVAGGANVPRPPIEESS